MPSHARQGLRRERHQLRHWQCRKTQAHLSPIRPLASWQGGGCFRRSVRRQRKRLQPPPSAQQMEGPGTGKLQQAMSPHQATLPMLSTLLRRTLLVFICATAAAAAPIALMLYRDWRFAHSMSRPEPPRPLIGPASWSSAPSRNGCRWQPHYSPCAALRRACGRGLNKQRGGDDSHS